MRPWRSARDPARRHRRRARGSAARVAGKLGSYRGKGGAAVGWPSGSSAIITTKIDKQTVFKE